MGAPSLQIGLITLQIRPKEIALLFLQIEDIKDGVSMRYGSSDMEWAWTSQPHTHAFWFFTNFGVLDICYISMTDTHTVLHHPFTTQPMVSSLHTVPLGVLSHRLSNQLNSFTDKPAGHFTNPICPDPLNHWLTFTPWNPLFLSACGSVTWACVCTMQMGL